MRTGQATGVQIAFLLFAVLLLSVPLSRALIQVTGASSEWRPLIERMTQFVVGGLLIAAIPGLRRTAARELSRPIPRAMRLEVFIVGLAKIPLAFAMIGVIALWLWASEGPPGLDRFRSDPGLAYANSVSAQGLVRNLVLATVLAPLVEELVCRCFLYRALDRRHGWLVAMLGSSLVFGLLHPHFAAAFVSGIVFACLYRRTGSLWAPIAVHSVFNFMLWWPMLGQHLIPWSNPGDLRAWTLHLACLAFASIAIPAYLWMCRDRNVTASTSLLDADGAVQK
jgi:membrane protease YdiL (CAAX protease family)